MSEKLPPSPSLPADLPTKTPPMGVPAVQPLGPIQTQPIQTQPVQPQPYGSVRDGSQGSSHASSVAPSPSHPQLANVGMPVVQLPSVGSVLSSQRGTYTVRAVLGSGEFGAVYETIGPFDQAYAVKVIRPANRPYAEVQREWANEARRLMSLRHPNVVYIHDAFEQNHLFFLALERCDHALHAMLGTPMQDGLVIELARQLLAAVQFLHDNDLVHDDLHPGNVLITHTDRPTVKISDFGISHELGGAPAIRPNVVHHKIMAPEVLANGTTSKQSDIYQIGLLLYWMLTGSPAIPTGVPYAELIRYVSEGIPRQAAESIGTPLGALIAKMLRRRDTFRYTSPREVWNDLRELPEWKTRDLFPTK